MENKEYYWNVGQFAHLPRVTKALNMSGMTLYQQQIGSRYICIREDSDQQSGILLKVLGKFPSEQVSVKSGQPFCKDDSEEFFNNMCYISYPFPTLKQLKEVLGILRSQPDLLPVFDKASMHVNPKSKFWVRETVSHMLVKKKAQCYDATADSFCKVMDDDAPYRVTIVYFHNEKLDW